MPNPPAGPTGPTGAAPSEPFAEQAKYPAESWPRMFWLLEWVELLLVLLLGVLLTALAGFLVFWVVTGCGGDIHARLVQVVKGMNTGWKVCLLILVPLFFRPVYKFMHYLREGPFRTKSTPLTAPESKSDDYGT
jgi:hypothetical protein